MMKRYLIEVKGDIVSQGGLQYAQNWACKGISPLVTDPNYKFDEKFSFDKVTHIVNGNLILTENRRAVPYAIYITEKSISATTDSGDKFYCYPGFGAAVEYYRDEVI